TLTNWVFQGLVWRSSPISSNRRMRTRLYGGVAGERGINIPRPYADYDFSKNSVAVMDQMAVIRHLE
ncbi:MAG TPA: hypothetical protein VLM37_01650, partial [Fibrobacteraceae bacterium]|nr:hypothetical protein [Fibrobacteraceae bacterium]